MPSPRLRGHVLREQHLDPAAELDIRVRHEPADQYAVLMASDAEHPSKLAELHLAMAVRSWRDAARPGHDDPAYERGRALYHLGAARHIRARPR